MTGNPHLIEVIHREIRERGPLPFVRFMELALYHPQHGYYTSGSVRIGRGGDFVTSASVGPVFGGLLGDYLAKLWTHMGKPKPFVALELGGNKGWLAQDILQWARQRNPRFAEALDYWVCERGQATSVEHSHEGKWFTDWTQIESDSVVGCIFSNELVDSFPVHRIRRENGAWRELYVDVKDDQFSFQSQPLSFPPGDLPSPLRYGPYPDGYTTEVNFAAFDWLEQMARILKRGVLLTIDYGYEDADYYAPHRTDGTLLCYHRHRTNCNPLDHVGEQDITAHVNFTRLTAWGQQIGLELRRFTDQSNFLVDSCREEIERIVNANPGQPDKARPQLQTLLHPGGMGRAFKVLVQEKRIGAAKLSGLKYTRPL